MKKSLLCLLFFFICCACRQPEEAPARQAIFINLQPFSDVPEGTAELLYKQLRTCVPHITLKNPINLPRMAYYAPGKRYRADSLIRYLHRRTAHNHVTIGLTTRDISSTKGNAADYGIMGLGYQPGSSCVVSAYRLPKKNRAEQLFKLTIHELGHTQGLPHCTVKTCYMRDAEGKNYMNEETGFCVRCKTHLGSKGWAMP